VDGDSQPAIQVLEHLEEAVVLVGPGQRVRRLNAAARGLFAPSDPAAGRPLLEIVRDHRLSDLAQQAASTGAEQRSDVDLPGEGGALRARAVVVAPGPTVALIVQDLTRLRHLETVRQQFVANVSHELRTPLAGLDLAAQTLAGQDEADPQRRQFVDRILQESKRLSAILQNLSELAALDAEQVPVEREAFALGPLLSQNVARFAARAEAAGLTLRGEAPDPDVLAFGDRAKTDQALQSLVDNALKFTVRGEVVILATASGDWVEIAVRDTGIGIPAQHLSRIFERFYKVDRARGSQLPGTGLGLAIARHLVELQGGTLAAESTPGAGTVMRLRLPSPPTAAG